MRRLVLVVMALFVGLATVQADQRGERLSMMRKAVDNCIADAIMEFDIYGVESAEVIVRAAFADCEREREALFNAFLGGSHEDYRKKRRTFDAIEEEGMNRFIAGVLRMRAKRSGQ